MTAGRLEGRFYKYWPKFRGIIAYGLGPILGLASGPLLARAMGPEGRGQFAAVMQPLTLAGAVASIGIPAAAAYFVAKGNYAPGAVLRRGIIISLGFSFLAYGGLVLYSDPVASAQGLDKRFLLIVWLLVFASAWIQIRRGYLQGLGSWKVLDLERFSFAILRFLAVVCLVALGVSAAEVFAIGSLGAFLIAGVIVWWPRKLSPAHSGSQQSISYSDLGTYSLSAALGTIAVVTNNRLDQVLLPLMAPSEELGFYAVAVTVAEVPLILGTLAARDALFESSQGKTPLQVLRSCSIYLVGATTLGVILALSAPFFMGPIFGASFSGAVLSVQLISLGTVFSCMALTLTAIISGRGRPGLSSFIPLSSLVCTLVLFGLLQSRMSSDYAALISAVSQVVSVLTGVFVVRAVVSKQSIEKFGGKQYEIK